MVLERAHVTSRSIDFAQDFPTAYDNHGPTQHVFLRVETAEEAGDGEGSALQWFTGETTETMEHIVGDVFLPRLLGLSVDKALDEFYEFSSQLPNHPGATSCIEMALLDLKAKKQGIPVWELLGRRHQKTIPIDFVVGAIPPADAATNLVEAYERGFRVFKIKATGDVATDIARLNTTLDALANHASPAEVNVRIDPNTGWKTFERTRSIFDQLNHRQYIEYLEQPVPESATEDLKLIRTSLGIPVVADEAVHSTSDLRRLLSPPRAISGFCAKLAKIGGFQNILSLSHLGAASDVPVTLVSAFETSLGFAANLHLAAVLPQISSAAELGANHLSVDPVQTSLDREPTKKVPDGPGLGVRLEDDVFEEARTIRQSETGAR